MHEDGVVHLQDQGVGRQTLGPRAARKKRIQASALLGGDVLRARWGGDLRIVGEGAEAGLGDEAEVAGHVQDLMVALDLEKRAARGLRLFSQPIQPFDQGALFVAPIQEIPGLYDDAVAADPLPVFIDDFGDAQGVPACLEIAVQVADRDNTSGGVDGAQRLWIGRRLLDDPRGGRRAGGLRISVDLAPRADVALAGDRRHQHQEQAEAERAGAPTKGVGIYGSWKHRYWNCTSTLPTPRVIAPHLWRCSREHAQASRSRIGRSLGKSLRGLPGPTLDGHGTLCGLRRLGPLPGQFHAPVGRPVQADRSLSPGRRLHRLKRRLGVESPPVRGVASVRRCHRGTS